MIYREQDIRQGRTYPFAGKGKKDKDKKVFFCVFPGRKCADKIGQFPFRITVACPYEKCEVKKPGTNRIIKKRKSWRLHPEADNVLMEFLSAIGIGVCHWYSAADIMISPPSPDKEELEYKRYSTCRSPVRRQEQPLVVDVEAVKNPYGVSSLDVVRLAGFVALINGYSPFFNRERIILTAPIDQLREFKSNTDERNLKSKFYFLGYKAFEDKHIDDIRLDELLRTVFFRLHSALRTYQNSDHPDVVSDYVFNLSRVLAGELTKAKQVPIRICPVCLNPLPPESRLNQLYCPMSSDRAWCGNVARDRRARKKATEDYARALIQTIRPHKAKK